MSWPEARDRHGEAHGGTLAAGGRLKKSTLTAILQSYGRLLIARALPRAVHCLLRRALHAPPAARAHPPQLAARPLR